MRLKRSNILADDHGSAAIEAAIALPVLFAFFGVIIQLSMMLFLQASVDHAIGEAARSTTVYPAPTDTEIADTARNAMFAGKAQAVREITVVRGTDNSRSYAEITMIYDRPAILAFINSDAKTFSETRRAYLP